MDIIGKIRKLYEIKKDIKAALAEKGIYVGDNILTYAAKIREMRLYEKPHM